MSKKVIFLIGPPGSGKGTQGKLLAQKTGFYRFITSMEGKQCIAENPDDAENRRQVENYKTGKLFDPEWLLNRVLKERTEKILKKEDVRGIIYEGSPRTLFEAEKFLDILAQMIGKDNIFVVVIEISDDEVRKRAGERVVCNKNEDHYITTRFSDLKPGDKCPQCDGTLIKRDLDSEVGARIEQYKNRTVPGIEYLKKTHPVIVVNGEQSIENVWKDLETAIDK